MRQISRSRAKARRFSRRPTAISRRAPDSPISFFNRLEGKRFCAAVTESFTISARASSQRLRSLSRSFARAVPASDGADHTASRDAPPPYDLIRTSDPNLKLPYTHQFNLSVEQSLGRNQTITASYVGAMGRRLLRGENILNPNANFGLVQPTRNTAESDYNAAQFQFQRRLARGLQAIASYTFAKSEDNQSDAVSLLPRSDRYDAQRDRSPLDFNVRHSFNAAVTYNILLILRAPQRLR